MMQFRVLGPLEVVHGGRPVPLGGAKQRAMLALLLLRANRVVATSELLEVLWAVGDGPPPTARKILQNAVRSLRLMFAAHAGSPALVTRPPGYVLQVDPDQVDLFRFHRSAERGRGELRSGAPEPAAATLRDALALWRGPALADLAESGVDLPELAAVRNARLDVLEDYFDAELASGGHQAALGELATLVEAEPLRERLCHQLMLALYRSGRQADALTVYGRARSYLVERLGLEPGRELQVLQQAILTHDPALTAPRRSAPSGGNPRPGPPVERELKVLDGLLEYVRQRAMPHLVTVVGPPGAELTRFIAGFEGLVAGRGDRVRFLRFPKARGRMLEAEILAAVHQVTADRPLVLAIDGVHRADDRLLDFIEGLTDRAGQVPLLLVATAWPELLGRRPEWSGGKLHATTLAFESEVGARRESRPATLLMAAS